MRTLGIIINSAYVRGLIGQAIFTFAGIGLVGGIRSAMGLETNVEPGVVLGAILGVIGFLICRRVNRLAQMDRRQKDAPTPRRTRRQTRVVSLFKRRRQPQSHRHSIRLYQHPRLTRWRYLRPRLPLRAGPTGNTTLRCQNLQHPF